MRYKLAIVDEYDEVVWTFRYLWLAIKRRFRKPKPYVPLDPNAPGALFLDGYNQVPPAIAARMNHLLLDPPVIAKAEAFWKRQEYLAKIKS